MKVELHCHTARYSQCAVATPHQMMHALIEAGYQAVYITEHDAVWDDWELGDLQKEFGRIRIFPGVELTIGPDNNQHLLVLGANDSGYLALKDAGAIIAQARRQGHLTVLAHPFRWAGGDQMLRGADLPDAIENLTCNQEEAASQDAQKAALRLGLPVVNAGDAHCVDMIGRYWIETDRDLGKADDIAAIIADRAYRNCVRKK
jgi:predicted metal-dependent phosphoesterase TrpH